MAVVVVRSLLDDKDESLLALLGEPRVLLLLCVVEEVVRCRMELILFVLVRTARQTPTRSLSLALSLF